MLGIQEEGQLLKLASLNYADDVKRVCSRLSSKVCTEILDFANPGLEIQLVW